MLNSQEIQTIRTILRSLLKEHDISYRVTPFDDKLYQECIDVAVRRGYPMDGDHSLMWYLPDGVKYVATTSRHYTHRPRQVWMALYIAANYFVDDLPCRFPSEISNIYLFNDRFIKSQEQGNAILGALADIVRQAPDVFQPVLSNLIITSTLDFMTATLVDCETTSMQISSAARQYPTYHRDMSGFADAPAFMVFPPEIPLTEYIQAIPEVMQFINELNDVLSFYKEELAAEDTNQISLMAARSKVSKLETLARMARSVTDVYGTIVGILEGSSARACDGFKQFVVGYFDFHFTVERYRLADLDL
ncbi:terpenoid synthase [Imleria badia]|nr:terpenoid synthase [Imleria badia]